MQVASLNVVLRRRSMYEACDLGVRLCQSSARSVYSCYLAVAVPLIAIAMACSLVADWLPILLIWWAKPWLDRTILFALSRALFGEKTQLRDLWGSRRQVWGSAFIHTWLLRRLSTRRAYTQPVYQLEGLRGKALRARLTLIRGPYNYISLIVTQLFAIAEFALLASGLWLIVWMTPTPAIVDWSSVPDHFFGAQSAALTSLLYAAVVCALEPMYVAAGFGMYLNRRVELEAWDIEQEFRSAFAT
jgi:hypothetical protein